MLNSVDSSKIFPDLKSQISYFCYYENSFQILKNQSTVIGIEFNKEKENKSTTLIKENLNNKRLDRLRFGIHSNQIACLLIFENLDCLIVGDKNGVIIQYSLETCAGKILKNYGYLNIGRIYSSAKLENLVVFGGWSDRIIFIDVKSRNVVSKLIDVAITWIYSLEFCVIESHSKEPLVLLIICGLGVKYSEKKTDILDVTSLFNQSKTDYKS